MPISSSFVFATCRAGSEALVKQEIQRKHGDLLRPAFMRPELITWKSSRPLDENFILGSSFARVEGVSLGSAKTKEEIVTLLSTLGEQRFHLHVFPRKSPDEKADESELWKAVKAFETELFQLLEPTTGVHPVEAKLHGGDLIVDVVLDEDLKTPCLVGFHKHSPQRHPLAGAFLIQSLPEDAPSRAYLKMVQSLAWLGLNSPKALQHALCVELGSAPGGASYALLERSANLIGVDTGRMNSAVPELAKQQELKYQHIQKSVADLSAKDLPSNIDILACDMNLAPPVVVHYLERLLQFTTPRLLILTLKLNDDKMVNDLPKFLQRLKKFRLGQIRTMQLPANRQEITVVAGKY